MKVKIQQFLFGKSHSWSIVGQNLGRALIKLGHEVDFISTDGIDEKFTPKDLIPFIKNRPVGNYDCQISYTAPHNWPCYLSNGDRNRFGIWNYEYNSKKFDNSGYALLRGYAKYYKYTDKILPSSNFTKEVFTSMKIPEDKMEVIPHGINLDDFINVEPWPLRTKKSRKILLNIAQPHRRKALPLALESFGKAFTKEDDVCLVAKIFKKNKTDHIFNVDFDQIYKTFKKKYPNHAEVELVYDYIPNIASIYKSCDINFSATYAECWHLPSLEALASGLINVVPRYGGQLDFCTDENSLLIDGRIKRADKNSQYWQFNPFAVHFEISTNDAATKLKKAVNEYNFLVTTMSSNMKIVSNKFTWENAAKMILNLCE